MSDKFQNKYRIPSARLPSWDYGANASYFVTICTKNRMPYFGDVANGVMRLSEIGQIAHQCWHNISDHFPFVILDAFVVMPNHVHGIVIIDKPGDGMDNGMDNAVETQNFASLPPTPTPTPQPTHNPPPPQSPPTPPPGKNKFGPQSQNLASIIRGYKIGVTKFANANHIEFGWQPRFHDHIIRNDASFARIQNYIETNPQNWDKDTFNN